MAIVKYPAGSLGAMQEGEQRLVKYLEVLLPDCHYLVPNLSLTTTNPRNQQVQVIEYDLIVVSPHGIYNIENKDWAGRLEGDDRYWYVNGKERKCPLVTNKWKTGVLASKLREQNPKWGKAWVETVITLSYPGQTKQGLWGDSTRRTFLLEDNLIKFIDDSNSVNKEFDAIEDIQEVIVNFLVGAHAGIRREDKKRILSYNIIEVLDQSDNYAEYLCKPADIASSIRFRVREYAMALGSLSWDERKQQENIIRNQQVALNKIKRNPFILNVQFHTDEESHTFYEISEYLDENSLRAEMQRRTFTFEERLNIIDNVITALQAAHEVSIFHRDVNPENIFLTNGYAALGNFGKSYFVDHHDVGYTVMTTLTENNIGSYHALELMSGDASRASDIYSLGILVYELFTGEMPVKSPVELNYLGGRLPAEKLPSARNNNLPGWLDEFCQHTIRSNPDDRWDNLEEVKAFLKKHSRPDLTQLTIAPPQQPAANSLDEIKPGKRIGVYTIYEPLGQGGFSRVYKVKHTLQGRDYAMKVFNESVDAQAVQREYQSLMALNHPNVVKFEWNDILPNGQFYTLMEYIEGRSLKDYTHGDLRLPLTKIYDLATAMLSALVDMQERKQPLYHRDIKPNNILWDREERFVLIDFNVAALADTDNRYVGTNPYIPPDLAASTMEVNWDKSADPFALGITLYELVCKHYPWTPGKMPLMDTAPKDPRASNALISDAFTDFLLKSINPRKELRFATAKAMQEALVAIGEQGILKEKLVQTPVAIPVAEMGSDSFPNYLNTLFSQSRFGNAGTRARQQAHPFDEYTYTETFLDKKLIPAVMDGSFRLVIITGNAGDGKTAFIHKVEKQAQGYKPFSHNNGGAFFINGVRYESNYDGSQDQDKLANNAVLTHFFQPFEELHDYSKAPEGRIIAINEGRLVEFLSTSAKHRQLSDIISDYFKFQGEKPLPKGLMVINLNLRSVTASSETEPSILRQQLKRLTEKNLWEKCAGCSQQNHCFIRYNVSTFNDSAAGDEVITRLEWLMQTAILRRELHVTIRDMRSFLAYMLTRDQRCKDVEALYKSSEPEQYLRYFYFNITDVHADDAGKNDRLVRLIREIDPAQTPVPQEDRDLYFDRHQSGKFIDFQDRDIELLEYFNTNKQILPPYEQNDTIRRKARILHDSFTRHQYFEGKVDYKRRLPYHSASQFHNLVKNPGDQDACRRTLKNVAKAIALNEGCEHPLFYENNIVLSSAHVQDPYSLSFRLFPLDDFDLRVNNAAALARFLEYEPDSLILRHKKEEHIQLQISLDMFEMLYFIQQGFTPSLNDFKGRFVELEIFKNLLENLHYNEVIVTRDNVEFFKIRETGDYRLIMSKLEV
ncbi:MAG: protein kinase [Chitinophagales bacterium]|nr:protein kinase [Chitinophagales bacterium]